MIMIEQAVRDHLLWMIDRGYSQGSWNYYERILLRFSGFIVRENIKWEDTFSPVTIGEYLKGNPDSSQAVRGLWRNLFNQGIVSQPPQRQVPKLPDIYEEYLHFYKRLKTPQHKTLMRTRRALFDFHQYLKKHTIRLSVIKIEDLDAFLAEYNSPYAPETRQKNRSAIRGFLRYLYHERRIIKRDLALLIVGAPIFAQVKPPKFLRPHEVRRLFSSIKPSSARDFRAYAILRLAYTLGLRPKEVSMISLDDISFTEGKIILSERKGLNPIKLPLPEDTIKAIAAYIIHSRPKSSERRLFLSLRPPYGPISTEVVSADITQCMRKANLSSSAYSLRHTYAQNLLEGGASIFEIKQMLGHDHIQTTKRYLHINTRLMREVLFDETL